MSTLASIFKSIFSTSENTNGTNQNPGMALAAKKAAITSLVIDGQNVVYGSGSSSKPSFMNVLGLAIELNDRNLPFKCFFDANTFYTLMKASKQEAYAYRRLCYDYPDLFIEVPGQNRADDFILDYVNKGDASIISNDRYRDFAEKYPWLTTHPDRRASFLIHSGIMQIVTFGITANIPTILNEAEAALRQQILKATGIFVPAVLSPQKVWRGNQSPQQSLRKAA